MSQFGGSDIFGDLSIDMESRNLLKTITTWAKISAIVGLISATLSIISIATNSVQSGAQQFAMLARFGLLFVIPFVVALIVLNIFLLRFATSTGSSLDNMSQQAFNLGISFLKMYFKTLGIIIIIFIGLCIVLVIAFGIGAAVGR